MGTSALLAVFTHATHRAFHTSSLAICTDLHAVRDTQDQNSYLPEISLYLSQPALSLIQPPYDPTTRPFTPISAK
jgi:hypothetical protein